MTRVQAAQLAHTFPRKWLKLVLETRKKRLVMKMGVVGKKHGNKLGWEEILREEEKNHENSFLFPLWTWKRRFWATESFFQFLSRGQMVSSIGHIEVKLWKLEVEKTKQRSRTRKRRKENEQKDCEIAAVRATWEYASWRKKKIRWQPQEKGREQLPMGIEILECWIRG